MRTIVASAVLVVAVGCGDESVIVRPVIDLPPDGSDAYPLDAVDELVLSVAELGSDTDIQLANGTVEDPPSLSGVPFGDDFVLHLSGRSSGVEAAYGRSCAFAAPDPLERELRLYFSLIAKWGPGGSPEVPNRTGGYGYAINDGARAVFIGGGAAVSEVEVFDAFDSGQFTRFPEDGPARAGAVLAPFGNGRSLLVGGVDAGDAFIGPAILLNPTGLTLQQEQLDGPMVVEHAAVTLVDDSVIVAGGRTPEGVTAEGWLYPAAGPSDLGPRESLPPLSIARAGHTMTRLGNELGADVLIVGGRDAAELPIAEAELYRPLREAYEPVDGTLLVGRWGHRAVRMPGGFVLIIGGLNPAPVMKLELYDPAQGVFSDAGDMPSGAGLTDLSVTPLPDGRVLLAGGRDETGTPVAATHIARLDPVDGRVVVIPTDDMDLARANHTAVQLCDGTTLVIGGTSDPDAPAERYNPPSAGRR